MLAVIVHFTSKECYADGNSCFEYALSICPCLFQAIAVANRGKLSFGELIFTPSAQRLAAAARFPAFRCAAALRCAAVQPTRNPPGGSGGWLPAGRRSLRVRPAPSPAGAARSAGPVSWRRPPAARPVRRAGDGSGALAVHLAARAARVTGAERFWRERRRAGTGPAGEERPPWTGSRGDGDNDPG